MYNEPNIPVFWHPSVNATAYAELAITVGKGNRSFDDFLRCCLYLFLLNRLLWFIPLSNIPHFLYPIMDNDIAAIKNATPQEIFIGPATSQIDFPFVLQVFQTGVLQYFDAVSVHP